MSLSLGSDSGAIAKDISFLGSTKNVNSIIKSANKNKSVYLKITY